MVNFLIKKYRQIGLLVFLASCVCAFFLSKNVKRLSNLLYVPPQLEVEQTMDGDYKYYEISEKDTVFIRSLLAYYVWNEVTRQKSHRRSVEPVLLLDDEGNAKAYVKASPLSGKREACAEGIRFGAYTANDIDYYLFLQATYAYKNLYDNYSIYELKTGEKYCVPGKVEYSFGIYPGTYNYLNYHDELRVISDAEAQMDGIALEYADVVNRWKTLRSAGLSNESIGRAIDEYASIFATSDYPEKSGLYRSDDDFKASDYYLDAVNSLKNEIYERLGNLDMYYANLDYESAEAYAYDVLDSAIIKEKNTDFKDTYLELPSINQSIRLYKPDDKGYFFVPSGVVLGHDIADAECIKSNNVHSIFITTVNGTMTYINSQKGNKESGTIQIYDENAEKIVDSRIEEIKCKGHSSFRERKKSYALTIDDEDYVLVANAIDNTKLRNALAMDYGKMLGLDTSDYYYADVYFNGEYGGNYLMMNAVKNPGDVLFEVNNDETRINRNKLYFYASDGIRYELDDSGDILVDSAVDMSISSIDAVNGVDSIGKLEEIVDVDTFAGMYIMDKVFDDVDANSFSTFYYIKGDKLYAGPLWDYDRTLGNNAEEKMWQDKDEDNSYMNGIPEHLFEQIPDFRKVVMDKWNNQGKKGAFIILDDKINMMSKKYFATFAADRIRWGISDGDYSMAIADMKEFLGERIQWEEY